MLALVMEFHDMPTSNESPEQTWQGLKRRTRLSQQVSMGRATFSKSKAAARRRPVLSLLIFN